jgi:hypothetical protein
MMSPFGVNIRIGETEQRPAGGASQWHIVIRHTSTSGTRTCVQCACQPRFNWELVREVSRATWVTRVVLMVLRLRKTPRSVLLGSRSATIGGSGCSAR